MHLREQDNMTAGKQRAKYLATLVLAFIYLGGGLLCLASYPLMSYIVLFAGMALLSYSAAGLFRLQDKHESFLRRK